MITLTETCTMPEEQLTSTQQTALSSLILGNTVSEAAGEAGVHRNTVHRWLKNDEPFQEARHRAQRDAQAAVEAKLHDTAMAAVDCIEKCLLEGDAYVAEQLLKGLGCFDGKLKDLGSEEAVALAREALHHSALSEMFDRETVVGQAVPDEVPQERQTSNRRQAQPDLREMERYASVFSTPDEADAMSENLQPSATSETSKSSPVNDDEPPSGQGRTYEVQHTATSVDSYADLTTQQTTALMALQTGQTIEEAAETTDTEVTTVYQWLHGDCAFQAAMNRCAGERRRAIHARVYQLSSLAADIVHHKIIQGNGRLAVRVLKGLGYLQGQRCKSHGS